MEKQSGIQEYLEAKKYLQKYLINFIEGEVSCEEDFQNLCGLFNDLQIFENKHELKATLHLLINISNNHHRFPHFNDKFQRIILLLKDKMQQNFTNNEIFHLFVCNKILLLFLFEENIITPDISMVYFLTQETYQNGFYHFYFYPEFQTFFEQPKIRSLFQLSSKFSYIQESIKENFELFQKKRRQGENDSNICQLIMNDLIDDFTSQIPSDKVLEVEIESSIFETNPFLLNRNPSLIEYAAFYGSIQIFKILLAHPDVKLNPSIWLYAIHGQNSEIIQLLSENQFVSKYQFSERCLIESIKCHNVDFTTLIQNQSKNSFNVLQTSLEFYDYNSFPLCFNGDDYSTFYYLCKFDYFTIVDSFLTSNDININIKYEVFLFQIFE